MALRLALARKLRLKFLYSTRRIHETLFTSVSGMRVHGYVAIEKVMIHSVDVFGLFGTSRRKRYELLAAGDVYKANGIQNRMYVSFHERRYPCLALKRGLVLLITYSRPLRRTTLQSG